MTLVDFVNDKEKFEKFVKVSREINTLIGGGPSGDFNVMCNLIQAVPELMSVISDLCDAQDEDMKGRVSDLFYKNLCEEGE